MKFDHIYIINLKTDNKIISKKLDDLKLSFRCGYEIFSAVNGSNLVNEKRIENWQVYKDWKIEDSDNKWYSRDITTGEVGCTLSHLLCWEAIANGEHNKVLILEEDFERQSQDLNISDIKNAQDVNGSNWDLCYLGRNPLKDKEEFINEDLVMSKFSYNTHAYILTKEGAKKILKHRTKILNNIIPCDELLSSMYDQHPREDIKQLFNGKYLSAVASKKQFIKQTSNASTSLSELNEPYYEILDDTDWEAWKEKYVNLTISKGEYDLMVDDEGDNIYEFPLFTEKFCREAINLAESKNEWTEDRHEYFPTNDVLLENIGLQNIYMRVIREIVSPLCIHLWKLSGKGWPTMTSENFMARYTTVKQSHLSLHHDASDITMVLKLNDEFDGGGTWFPRSKILSNPERVGTATLHPGGVTHLHGARPIYSGKRYVLISFIKKGT